jgi:hypothetical protein
VKFTTEGDRYSLSGKTRFSEIELNNALEEIAVGFVEGVYNPIPALRTVRFTR